MKSRIDWKTTLQEDLGEDFEVFLPKMPNVTNVRYEEWKIYFEKALNLLKNDSILIGHSLGGIFLAKYLDENKPTKDIKATILVASPFDDKDLSESLAEFSLDSQLENFKKYAGKIYLVQSKDDPVVPISQLEKYKKLLPEAEVLILDGMGHFKIENFPELVDLIENIN